MSNFLTFERFYFSVDILFYISKYAGFTFVVKYGGSTMKNKFLELSFIQDLCLLHLLGIKIILVHGGGYLINNWLRKLNIVPKFENGLRVTDANTMEVVEMVLSGKINKHLISLFNQNNIPSVGLSGKDANLITAIPINNNANNCTGKVVNVNGQILNTLLDNQFFPVVASVAPDLKGCTYNINADTLASYIASSVKVEKLILLTDTPGLLYDINDELSVIKNLNLDQVNDLKSKGIIQNGMIPKIDCCVHAIKNRVPAVHIIDGRLRYSLLYEVLTDDRNGSMLVC
uniref:Acetylglutamate kinase n=1 Tax=Pleurostichidium falkenbergii TaxID=121064 RepID=A0A4D6UXJ3_9FLOR|nr:acetylglutamate kinase [Pleurostichidium falkenbergii]QCH39731.1 acetylglutamate kinase [Pleurostichidium falkenbergii]